MLKIIISYDMISTKEAKKSTTLLVDFFNKFIEREVEMNNKFKTNNSTYSYQESIEPLYLDNEFSKNNTSIFVVSNYIIDVVSSIRYLMNDPNYFIFNSENESIKRFSFSSTKLQKIIIISVLEYLTEYYFSVKDYPDNDIDDIDENFVKWIINYKNPIEDLTTLINRSCGFLFEYNFLMFGLTSPYNKNYNGDKKVPLSKFFNSNYNNGNIKDYLLNSEKFLYEVDKKMYSEISNRLKNIIMDVIIKFILYPPYELGLLLNKVKGDEIPNIKVDSENIQKVPLKLLLLSSISMILTKLNGEKIKKRFIDIITEE